MTAVDISAPPSFYVAETWAHAVAEDPALLTFVLLALDLRSQPDCKVEDWQTLVWLLVEQDLSVEVYDAAVDVLHLTAAMPCRCTPCVRQSYRSDAEMAASDRLLPVTDGTRTHPAHVEAVAAKYDQTGRFRIRR